MKISNDKDEIFSEKINYILVFVIFLTILLIIMLVLISAVHYFFMTYYVLKDNELANVVKILELVVFLYEYWIMNYGNWVYRYSRRKYGKRKN